MFLEPEQLNTIQDNLPLDHTTILILITLEESIKVHIMDVFILEMLVNIIYVFKINLLEAINSKFLCDKGMRHIWEPHNLSIQI